MSKQKLIQIIFVLAAVAGISYIIVSSSGNEGVKKSFLDFWNKKSETGNVTLGENPIDKSGLTEEYINYDFGFSFKYPKGFNVSELDDDSGHTVLVQSYEVEPRKGFQIYISEFDEPEPLTAERILQDLPPSEVIDPKGVLIGEGKAINAVIFLSTSPSFGKTREIWFAREGFLYQVTTYEGQDNFIGPILETFRFE